MSCPFQMVRQRVPSHLSFLYHPLLPFCSLPITFIQWNRSHHHHHRHSNHHLTHATNNSVHTSDNGISSVRGVNSGNVQNDYPSKSMFTSRTDTSNTLINSKKNGPINFHVPPLSSFSPSIPNNNMNQQHQYTNIGDHSKSNSIKGSTDSKTSLSPSRHLQCSICHQEEDKRTEWTPRFSPCRLLNHRRITPCTIT